MNLHAKNFIRRQCLLTIVFYYNHFVERLMSILQSLNLLFLLLFPLMQLPIATVDSVIDTFVRLVGLVVLLILHCLLLIH